MEIEIRDYSSADIDNISSWEPSSLDDVHFQLTLEICEKGKQGGNLFQLVVATPEGLRKAADSIEGYEIPDRNLLICADYNWDAVLARINRIITKCTRETWTATMSCLQRYFQWEYEDYVVG
jgi:hypothetical protein